MSDTSAPPIPSNGPSQEGVCPHCGYCPHCGRANPYFAWWGVIPPYPQPWQWPWWNPSPTITTTTTSFGNVTVRPDDYSVITASNGDGLEAQMTYLDRGIISA